MSSIAMEKGDASPKQLAMIGALLVVLCGVLYFQLVVKKKGRGGPVAATESVAALAEKAAALGDSAAPVPAAVPAAEGAPAAPAAVDLETLDASTLVLPGGRLAAGSRPAIDIDPFAPSPETLLAFRARDPRFAALSEAERAEEASAAQAAAYAPPVDPTPKLRATVVDVEMKLAILNDRIMGVGESISGYELADVTPEGVVLRKDGADTTLVLEER